MKPLVSVIIPTYNRKEKVKRALQSVIKQTYKNWEAFVIDDGSTDDSIEILKAFQAPHIHIIRQEENRGVSFARNLGIQKAQGSLICFLDSDDEWLEQKLEKQIESYKKNLLPIIHTDEIWIRNGVRVNPKKIHKKYGGRIFKPSLLLCTMSPSTVMIHKKVFKNIGGFREDFVVCEDYELWLRISCQYNVDFIPEPLIKKYGGHKDQLSKKFVAMDYFRVKALHSIKNSFSLTKEEQAFLYKTLQRKCKILLNGYKKHNNMTNFKEISSIFEESLKE